MFTAKCPAKINLSLDITGIRDNGYHEVKMIMQSVSLYDTVTITKEGHGNIALECNLPYVPCDSRNIAYKSAYEFFAFTGIKNDGVKIFMDKKIPVSAGLAGGSSNAAGVLLLLDKIYNTKLNKTELMEIGLKLGADIPFCLFGQTALACGIGERLTAVRGLTDCYILLAKPSSPLSTGVVYREYDKQRSIFHPFTDEIISFLEKGDLYGVSKRMYNVLENISIKLCPVIVKIQEIMREFSPLGVMMSGSGPTSFAIFDNEEKAKECAANLKGIAANIDIVKPVEGIICQCN